MNISSELNSQHETSDDSNEAFSQESLTTLKILDEVATGQSVTQRDLSKKLGIALGMTNNYLKRLATLGYIQITQAERKRLHYLLTPKGIAEKSALTYRYIKRSYRFFTETKERIRKTFLTLQEQGVQSVVLYKATVLTEIAVLALLDSNLKLVAIVDDDMAGKQFLGHRVERIKAVEALPFDRIVITTWEPVDTVITALRPHGVTQEKICAIQ
jgi:ribosomal protein S25